MKTQLFLAALAFSSVLPLACSRSEKPEPTTEQKRAADKAARIPKPSQLSDQSGPGGQREMTNREALIPPQCYTRTEQRHNPCYVCHQNPNETEGHENRMRDGYLQGDYHFSEFAVKNHWENLFVDRTAAVAKISDEEIGAYVGADNYEPLREKMASNEAFRGWKPDLAGLAEGAKAFDEHGFAKDGSGWVAFNYMPLPSTFWPTNGSTDDVMIRLPAEFRRKRAEDGDRTDYYLANLSVLEAAIKNLASIDTPELDERSFGSDLNGDGKLGRVKRILRPETYFGAASNVKVETFLFPRGTEFLHTVRYVGVDARGGVHLPPRMKEVRYMKKHLFAPKHALAGLYDNEFQEKLEAMPPYYGDFRDQGVDNGFGWLVQGYLEDREGALRPNSYEETLYCMGCHSTIGSTIDHTFAFGRKVEGARGWGYVDLRAMTDTPALGEAEGEILTYLRRVGGGSEFRNNDEMQARWFRADGSVDETKVKSAPDVYTLITPSPERARLLNKAYRVIVAEQSFLRGRDATVTPPVHVFREIDREVEPLLEAHRHAWDLRLGWSKESAPVLLSRR